MQFPSRGAEVRLAQCTMGDAGGPREREREREEEEEEGGEMQKTTCQTGFVQISFFIFLFLCHIRPRRGKITGFMSFFLFFLFFFFRATGWRRAAFRRLDRLPSEMSRSFNEKFTKWILCPLKTIRLRQQKWSRTPPNGRRINGLRNQEQNPTFPPQMAAIHLESFGPKWSPSG